MRKESSLFIMLFFLLIGIGFTQSVDVYAESLGAYASSESFGMEINSKFGEQGDRWDKEKNWSKRDLCRFMQGCFDESEGECYPFGYIMNYLVEENQFCSRRYISKNSFSMTFTNQFESGENCIYDFECKSNFCFNGKCSMNEFSQENIETLQNKINDLEKENKLIKEILCKLGVAEWCEIEVNVSMKFTEDNNLIKKENTLLTGEIVDNSTESKNWISKLWKKIFAN